MRFLLDENFPVLSARDLAASGHEIFLVAEQCPGATDEEVLALAVKLNSVLVTFDRDFGRLIFVLQSPCPHSIIYLRVTPQDALEPAKLVKRLLVNAKSIDGNFIVLEREQYRRRKLPANEV